MLKRWQVKKGKAANAMQIITADTYRLPPDIHHVLLIQLGDIGDVVWTTPAIRAVRQSLPKASVSLMVREGFGSLLEADPDVYRLYEIRRQTGNIFQRIAGHLSFLKSLRDEQVDLAVDLRLGDRGAFMAFLSGAPIRITMHHPPNIPLLRRLFFSHAAIPCDVPPERGAAEQTLRILRTLGIDTADKLPRLIVSDYEKHKARKLLAQKPAFSPARWISINPYSRWSYKEWSEDKWVEIIEWLWETYAIAPVIIGSLDEAAQAHALMERCKAPVLSVAGKTTLAELAGLLSLSLLHIGVDSAAPHIAAAVGTPTVTIYGPSSWLDWAPVGNAHRIIIPDRTCAPCHAKGCNGSGRSLCLDELSVEKVKETLRAALDDLLSA